MKRLRTVALLAREAGLSALRAGLLRNPAIDLACVAVHRRLPSSEDAARGERPEFAAFASTCRAAGVPLVEADTRPLAKDLDFLDGEPPIDLLVSVSWRYILSPRALGRPAWGALNLHRGQLPEYAGAEPVRRMIEDRRPDAVITAHLMVEEVDAGPILGTVHLPMGWDGVTPPAEHAEVVKRRLLPLYPRLLDLGVAALGARHGDG